MRKHQTHIFKFLAQNRDLPFVLLCEIFHFSSVVILIDAILVISLGDQLKLQSLTLRPNFFVVNIESIKLLACRTQLQKFQCECRSLSVEPLSQVECEVLSPALIQTHAAHGLHETRRPLEQGSH